MNTKVTLDQWQSFITVWETGSYTAAAQALNRSQSAISYSISKMEDLLCAKLFIPQGRNIQATALSEKLYLSAKRLITDAQSIEGLVSNYQQDWEPEITLVADIIFPNELLISALKKFADKETGTRVQLEQGIYSSIPIALKEERADLGISPFIPNNMIGETLLTVEFLPVAAPDFPLIQKHRKLRVEDLVQEVQIVIKDDSPHQNELGWLGGHHRWSVTNINSAIDTIKAGMGFGWLPTHRIRNLLSDGELVQLPLQDIGVYQQTLHLVSGSKKGGNARSLLSDIFRETVMNNDHGKKRQYT